jgi:hypothetical protein
MASSSVNPLVQEVIIKPEMLNRSTTETTGKIKQKNRYSMRILF